MTGKQRAFLRSMCNEMPTILYVGKDGVTETRSFSETIRLLDHGFDDFKSIELIDTSALVCEVIPDQVTLVPDAPDAITSNAGWDTVRNHAFLKRMCASFKERGIRTSIFIDPDPKMAEGAFKCGADRVELYTAAYAANYAAGRDAAIAPYLETAKAARELGLGLNAGHDLSLENLAFFIQTIPWTDEVSIGHALICDALYLGLETTIREYLAQIQNF